MSSNMSPRKPNVIIAVQSATPLTGAPAQRLYSFYRILSKKYNTCIVGGRNIGEPLSRKLSLSIVKAEWLGSNYLDRNICEVNAGIFLMMRFPMISAFINTILSLFESIYILSRKPEVIVVSIPPPDLLLPVFMVSRIIRALFIVDMRDPAEEVLLNKASRPFEKIFARIIHKVNYSIYKRADAIIVVTDRMKAMLESKGVNSIVIPNGADLTVFRPSKNSSQQKTLSADRGLTLIFSGTAAEYYDLKSLIVLMKILNGQGYNIKLLLAGSIEKNLEDFVHKLGITRYVHYLGFLPPEKLAKEIFPKCDIGVIPRVVDPIYDYAIPAKFYEYIASGLPVLAICRRESALANIVLKYDVGWVCEPQDFGCITSILKNIYLDHDVIEMKRRNALKLRKQIDREIQSRKFLVLLETLLKSRKSLRIK